MKKGRKLNMNELDRVSLEKYKNVQKLPVTVVLDNIRSLHNIGSVFRTSDAFAVKEVILCGITATPPHREIQKTALGATESVKWSYCGSTKDVVSKLCKDGVMVIGVEQVESSMSPAEFQPDATMDYAFIFGNEVNGVEQEVLDLCDEFIEIPQSGTKHSLNISVSVGIVLWEVYRKFRK